MAGSIPADLSDNDGVNGLRRYVGDDAWKRAFPYGVTRDTTNAPPIDNGHTGNPWKEAGKIDGP